MNVASLITITIVLVVLLFVCIMLNIKIISIIRDSNAARAKIKERRYLGFKDYIDTILLSVLFCLDISSIIVMLYILCKIWGVF